MADPDLVAEGTSVDGSRSDGSAHVSGALAGAGVVNVPMWVEAAIQGQNDRAALARP